jgi:hypothetical protein
VLYEFGVDHEAHKTTGEIVLRAALASGSLFWNELAVLERKQDRDLTMNKELLKIRCAVANRLEAMADAVAEHNRIGPLNVASLDAEEFPTGSREAEYANAVVSRYKEVEIILLTLPV